jgi:rhamnosyltransferase subunit B
MKILLASLGTAGDVNPFLAIGEDLQRHGHRVELLSSACFAPAAAAAGLDFCAVGAAQDFDATFNHHFVWDPVKGLGVMWRYLARPALEHSYRRIEQVWREERCVVLYSPFLMPAARIASESLDVPVISAYTSPAMIRSAIAPLSIAHWHMPRGVPAALCRLGWHLLDRFKMQPLALPALEALRGSLGLPALESSVFGQWIHAPRLGLTLFPRWYAPAAADWPAQIVEGGFPIHDGDARNGLSQPLQEFLAAGSAPVIISTGSAMQQSPQFMLEAVRACELVGRRAVLLGRAGAQLGKQLPATVLRSDYEPFGLLLSQASLLLHHGGIGSSAQALRAGIPQLVLPHAYDQFDNAMRLQALGVARSVAPARATAATLARQMQRLFDDAGCGEATRAAAQRIAAAQPLQRIRAAIESLA